jgi:replicative DNA helicase
MEIYKLPPQDLELERAILGAILIESQAMHTVLGIIPGPDAFYKESHQIIYSAILSLFKASQPIDAMTVMLALKKAGQLERVGGMVELAKFTDEVSSAANTEYHCRILQQLASKRLIIQACGSAVSKSYDDTSDPFEVLDKVQQAINRLTNGLSAKKEQTLDELLPLAFSEIEDSVGAGGITGVPSGFITLDEITGGWQKSDLIILAARPGAGKTTLAVNAARNAAVDFERPGILFSLEMSNMQLVKKMIASENKRTTSELVKGKIRSKEEAKQMARDSVKLYTKNFILDDTPGISINQIKAKCHKLKAERNIQWVVIDYLQLITPGQREGSREQEVSAISRALKVMAKELDVPVIALAQLSRSVETRGGDKRPILSDLRESGGIENDADMVIFLYRPEYYGITQDENGQSLIDRCEVLISKHRNGKVCIGEDALLLGCQMKYSKFFDLKGTPIPIPSNNVFFNNSAQTAPWDRDN